MSVVNIAPVTGDLLKIATAIFSVAVPIVSTFVISHLHISKKSVNATVIDAMVKNGARLALNELRQITAEYPTLDIKNLAIANATNEVLAFGESAFKQAGYTPDKIAKFIGGELESLLHVAPSHELKNNNKPSA